MISSACTTKPSSYATCLTSPAGAWYVYTQRFRLTHQYTAATINAIDFMNDDPNVSTAAASRLIFALHVLEQGSLTASPGIKRVSHFSASLD